MLVIQICSFETILGAQDGMEYCLLLDDTSMIVCSLMAHRYMGSRWLPHHNASRVHRTTSGGTHLVIQKKLK